MTKNQSQQAIKKLPPKRQAFVREYIIDFNGTQAAIRAGYSAKTAKAIGCELLTFPDVAAAIANLKAERAARNEITADRVLQELALLGFSNMQDYMRVGLDGDPYLNFSDLTRDQAAALAEVTVEDFKDGRGEDARDVRRVKFKLADKRAALVDIGKHIGMFKSQFEVSGPGGGAIPIAVTDDALADKIAAEIDRVLSEGQK